MSNSQASLLVITDAFYPDPRVGSVRVGQFCRHLAEDWGWQITVAARDRGFRPSPKQLAEQIHASVELVWLGGYRSGDASLVSQSTIQNASARPSDGRFRRLLQAAVRPDPSLVFWLRQISGLLRLVRQCRPQLIISTSPPHAVHIAAMLVAKRTGAPWVCDFRDPYVLEQHRPDRPKRPLTALLDRGLESAMVRHAAAVIHAIPLHGRKMRRMYPAHAHKMHIIPNGVPDSLLNQSAPAPTHAGASAPLVISVIGYLPDETAQMLHAAASLLQAELGAVLVRAVGRPSQYAQALADENRAQFQSTGRVAHNVALDWMRQSHVLICALEPERQRSVRLSSKLFEYCAVGVPFVVINPTRCDRWLLRQVPWCVSLQQPSVQSLADALRQAASAEAREKARANPVLATRYSRSSQAADLSRVMLSLVENVPVAFR